MSEDITKGNTTGTQIDLGDDLIEKTAVRVQESEAQMPAVPVPRTEDEIEDQLASAEILLNEGLVEEAKRVLRRVLVADSKNSPAKKKLEEIHDLELKQIFGENPSRGGPRKVFKESAPIDGDQVLQELDRDLNLGLLVESGPEAVLQFTSNLDIELSDLGPRDRIDVGIAFMEMGAYALAITQFKAVIQDEVHGLAAQALLANARILGGQPFEAVLGLEPLLRDSEIPQELKLDLIYLMGRAHQVLGKQDSAFTWYQQALTIDPGYRDIQERLRGLKKSTS